MFEVRVTYTGDEAGGDALLYPLLLSAGLDAESLSVLADSDGGECVCVYTETCEAAREISAGIDRVDNDFLRVEITDIGQEWKVKWRDSFKPFDLTRTVRVVPFGETDRSEKESIYIDTELVFGSGMHPTTKSISSFVEACAGEFESFFDIGTGTGILAILAAKKGAKKIWCLDICKDAVQTAKHNAEINNVSFEKCEASDFGLFEMSAQFDFVAANLLTDVLLEYQEKIKGSVAARGLLAVSGISDTNRLRFLNAFNMEGFKILEEKQEKEWAAFLLQKQ